MKNITQQKELANYVLSIVVAFMLILFTFFMTYDPMIEGCIEKEYSYLCNGKGTYLENDYITNGNIITCETVSFTRENGTTHNYEHVYLTKEETKRCEK